MRPEEELKKLAIDIYKGHIFGSWNLKSGNDLRTVFMCFAFMDGKTLKKLGKKNIVHFCEYIDKAGPHSINGLPSFFSMQTISKSEWDFIVPIIEKLQKAESELVGKTK